ncbi:MAG: DUF4256 domain-containing protein [Acidobacteria bacterium]|nr:DUF4256 domain-containing protein [Acidobacteriota bacterium]
MKAADKASLVKTLEERFRKHPERHKGVDWSAVEDRLEANARARDVLLGMERSGGEPDVIGVDKKSGAVTFCDCAAESPKDRRSLCYDAEALASRKENKPRGSAMEVATSLGIELLTEAQYRALQTLGEFDLKTSSWVNTPPEVRKLGGALFCDRRFGLVFVYHNGAESYYAARGFRGSISV